MHLRVVNEASRVYDEAGHELDPEDLRAKYRDWRDNRSTDQQGKDCSIIDEPK